VCLFLLFFQRFISLLVNGKIVEENIEEVGEQKSQYFTQQGSSSATLQQWPTSMPFQIQQPRMGKVF
jgi:hypothetical protein